MATVFFNEGDYTATLYRREGSFASTILRVMPQGEIHTIPDSFIEPDMPWEPTITHSIRITPNGEDDIAGVSSVPPETIEPGTLPEFQRTWYWEEWDSNTDYEIVVNVGDEDGGNLPTIVSPYNRVYLVDSGIIEQFSMISAFVPNADGTASYQLNNTDYIIALLNIPFKLPDDVGGSETTIQLGKVDTEIDAPKVESDIIHVPLGEIVVDDLLNNSIDYVATEYVLVLPYIADTIPLNPEWVIDKVISVEYLLDAYTGDITVNVYNGGDVPITSVVSSIGRTIPFKTLMSNPTELGRNSGAYNGTLAAYIRKSRNETYSGEFSNFVSSEGDLGDYLGYVEVDTINLKTSATFSENQSIASILASGVIIQ